MQLPQEEEEMKEERNGAGDRDPRMWTRRSGEGRGRGQIFVQLTYTWCVLDVPGILLIYASRGGCASQVSLAVHGNSTHSPQVAAKKQRVTWT